MFEIVSALVALVLVLSIAFPHILLPEGKRKQKKVGSSYWGVYEGAPSEDKSEEQEIEVPLPARQRPSVVGSSMYAMGKGTSFRR